MKRTIVVVSVLMVLVLGFATAQGRMMGPDTRGFGGQGFGLAARDIEVEEVSRTGRLVLAEDEFPALNVGSVNYTLRLHPAIIDEVELRNGQEISVTGGLVEMKGADLLTTYRVIHVSTLEAGGTKVVAPEGSFTGAMGGRARGGASRGGASRGGMYGQSFSDDAPSPGWNSRRQ